MEYPELSKFQQVLEMPHFKIKDDVGLGAIAAELGAELYENFIFQTKSMPTKIIAVAIDQTLTCSTRILMSKKEFSDVLGSLPYLEIIPPDELRKMYSSG